MPKLKIDGIEVEVPAGITVLQLRAGRPSRSRVSATTSACRSPATAACAWSSRRRRPKRSPPAGPCTAMDNMVIHTNMVRRPVCQKARKGL